MLLIPREVGGSELAPFAKGIGSVEDGFLKIEIRSWLAEKLGIHVGAFAGYTGSRNEKSVIRID